MLNPVSDTPSGLALTWARLRLPHEALSCHGRYRLRRYRVPLSSPALAGRRLLFVSDLHWPCAPLTAVTAVLDAAAARCPDWVVFGGDLACSLEHVPAALRVLAAIPATVGRFAVLGNRERYHHWLDLSVWRQLYADAGYCLLVNEVRQTAGTGPSPAFAGLDDVRYGAPDLPRVAESTRAAAAVVLVTHSPDPVAHGALPAGTASLVLAGHTHGGQVRLPGLGPVYTSSAAGRSLDLGWFRRGADGPLLYVTAGFGNTGRGLLRTRFRCPPEVVSLEFDAVASEAWTTGDHDCRG